MNQKNLPPDAQATKSSALKRTAAWFKRSADYLLGRTDQLPSEGEAEAKQQFEAEMEQIQQRRAARRQSTN